MYTEDIIVYIENPQEYTKNTRINELMKIMEHKVNTQKPIVLLYIAVANN